MFGTSGHRGSSLNDAFNEDHILATTQAICDYRASQGFDGPLFIGRDTHGLSEPAWKSALEVLVANGVEVSSTTATATRRRRPCRTRSSARTVGRRPDRARARRRHRRHAVAQPARGRRLQVQPAPRRPRRHRRDVGHRGTGQRADPRRAEGVQAGPVRPGASELADIRLPGLYVDDLPGVVDLGEDPGSRRPDRRRPARAASGRLLGRDRRTARDRPHRRQPGGRPARGRS